MHHTQFKQLAKWASVGRGGIVANRRGSIPAAAHLSNFPKRAFFSLGIQLLLGFEGRPSQHKPRQGHSQLDPMGITFGEGLCTPYTVPARQLAGQVGWPQAAIGSETLLSKRSSVAGLWFNAMQ
jgi:hypothetical protein